MKIQEWIHRFEVGSGSHYLRVAVAVFGFLALALVYNLFEYRSLDNPEAMDTAQVARNVARGRGFTTQFVRPLSLRLVEQHQRSRGLRTNDFGMLESRHPDLANPPVYPLFLAGAMCVLPFDFTIPRGRSYRHFQPDLLIALANQALFLTLVCLTFRLAARLFDSTVAWATAIGLAGSELLWRFTMSGLSTLLLLNLFVLLAWCLTSLDRRARDDQAKPSSLLLLAACAGFLVGLGALTRYSYGWLIVPVAGFAAMSVARQRWKVTTVVALVFLAVLAPWLARNHSVSGTWFGTAGYSAMAEIYPFKSDEIERSLDIPTTEASLADAALRKLLVASPTLLQQQVPTLGGSWLTAFFIAGLLVPFVDPTRNRLRLFTVAALVLWLPVQGLTRTELTTDSGVHGENLLVLAAPLVFIFGVAWFVTLLDQLPAGIFQVRQAVFVGFMILLCLPLILALLPPRRVAHAFPPYHPVYIQTLSHWLEEEELMMGDLPWANAWYGDRQCVWIPLKLSEPRRQNDFYAIHDLHKPVRALHLTHQTLDAPFFTRLYATHERGSWGHFVLGVMQAHAAIQRHIREQAPDGVITRRLQEQIVEAWRKNLRSLAPEGFPLPYCPFSYLSVGQLYLTDRDRWSGREPVQRPPKPDPRELPSE